MSARPAREAWRRGHAHKLPLAAVAAPPPGRPIRVWRHYNIGAGKCMHVPCPTTTEGGTYTGTLSTGAKWIAPADAIDAPSLAKINAAGKSLGMSALTASFSDGAMRIDHRLHGSSLRQPVTSATPAAQDPLAHVETNKQRKTYENASAGEQRRRDRKEGTVQLSRGLDQTLKCPHEGCQQM